MIKSIVTNKERLAIPSQPIKPLNDRHEEMCEGIITDMQHTALHHQSKEWGCVGLAANQIGWLYRIILVWHGAEWITMINPEVDPLPGKSKYMHESCLSRPGVRKKLQRAKKIKLRYLDENFETIERKFTGFTARVVQHEVDHLNGIYI